MYMDEIKMFVKKKKDLEKLIHSLRIYSDDDRHRKVCHTNNEKWKTANDGRNRSVKSRKYQNGRRKGNLERLKPAEMERKLEKNTLREREKC